MRRNKTVEENIRKKIFITSEKEKYFIWIRNKNYGKNLKINNFEIRIYILFLISYPLPIKPMCFT